jgi:hypothetical protein
MACLMFLILFWQNIIKNLPIIINLLILIPGNVCIMRAQPCTGSGSRFSGSLGFFASRVRIRIYQPFQNSGLGSVSVNFWDPVQDQWWYSERFVVITRQLLAAKCSLSSQLFGHIFTLLENLRFPYCCTPCKQTFVRLVCSSLGPCIKNLLFNFR